MYAIIESCGRQYKVEEGTTVFFEKLGEEEGKKVSFDKVILVSDLPLHYFLIISV